MRRSNPLQECLSNRFCGVGVAVLAAGVLCIISFRAASLIDPRRPDGYDEMILYLASYSFIMIPCAVFVLLGINVAIVGKGRPFLQGPTPGGASDAWRETMGPARDGFRQGSRTTEDEEGILPARPDDSGLSTDAFSPKLPTG